MKHYLLVSGGRLVVICSNVPEDELVADGAEVYEASAVASMIASGRAQTIAGVGEFEEYAEFVASLPDKPAANTNGGRPRLRLVRGAK